jgi:hypothetical protein
MPDMKRLQVMIEEDLDEALGAQALREGTSKAALIRRHMRSALRPTSRLEDDPLWKMAGVDAFEPVDIDDVVYR